MSRQDVKEQIDQAVQQGIVAGVDPDEIRTVLAEAEERLLAVEAYQNAEEQEVSA